MLTWRTVILASPVTVIISDAVPAGMKKAVLYDSNTGNTRMMAEAIAEGAREAGDDVWIQKVQDADRERMLACDVIYLGCPAMGREQTGDGQTDLMADVGKRFAGKKVAIFGSCRYGTGMWLRNWGGRLQAFGADVFDYPGVMAVGKPSEEVLEMCRELGRASSDR